MSLERMSAPLRRFVPGLLAILLIFCPAIATAQAPDGSRMGNLLTTSASERDAALANGYVSLGTCCSVFTPPPASAPTILYRLLGGEHGDHLFTTELAEADSAILHYHYTQEDNCCYVYRVKVPGSTELYRLRGVKTGDRLYTISASERAAVLASGAYTDEGICCYVPTASAGTQPLFRMYNAKRKLHFYTTSNAEVAAATAQAGYASEGICCVVAAAPATIPLYRMFQPGALDHFYTVSITERGGLLKHGYNPEGICCYVAADPKQGVPLFRLYASIYNSYNSHFYTVDPAERDTLKSRGMVDEGVCCTVASAAADQPVSLYRAKISLAPPPKIITFSASPNGGYNPAGTKDTISWQVAWCTVGCSVTLKTVNGTYPMPVNAAGLPSAGSMPYTPADTTDFQLNVATPSGTAQKSLKLQIAPGPAPAHAAFTLSGPNYSPLNPKIETPFTATVTVRNIGTIASPTVTVQFSLDGAASSSASLAPIAPGGTAPVTTSFTGLAEGVHQLEWKILQSGTGLGVQLAVFDSP